MLSAIHLNDFMITFLSGQVIMSMVSWQKRDGYRRTVYFVACINDLNAT